MTILSTSKEFRLCSYGAECVNGCGPKGFGWLIPDRINGLDLNPACNIHDCDYKRGLTWREKIAADRRFKANLLVLGAPGWLSSLYYAAVLLCGWRAFYLKRGICNGGKER